MEPPIHIDPRDPPIEAIHDLLLDAFVDAQALLEFCSFHNALRRTAREFTRPLKLSAMVADLIDYCDGQELWDELLAAVAEDNPNKYAKHAPDLRAPRRAAAGLAAAQPPAPARDEWCLAHPYPMPPNFTGRAAERDMLTRWLAGDGAQPLFVLRALGGFGKSALAWHWLLHDVDPRTWPRVVWWSFYEGDASVESFLRDTLVYLGLDPRGAGPRQAADALLYLLHRPGLLLVLDGFERALRAFSSINAAYQGDDEAATPEPQGLSGEPSPVAGRRSSVAGRPSSVAGGHPNDCVSPAADYFLRAVCALPGIRGRVLMTTRLRPRAVETRDGTLLAGCREEELGALSAADAAAFFRAQGVRGSRAELERLGEPYGCHPLSLRLLAGLIARDPRQPGDAAAARRLDVSGGLVQRQHHVLEQAYDSLGPDARLWLGRVACFRSPMKYEALAALARTPPTAGLLDRFLKRTKPIPPGRSSEQGADLSAALVDLVVRGLLHHDREAGRYDLHPIVRRYAYDRLAGAERGAAHARLRDYFAAVPRPSRVRALDDLGPAIELYHHTVRAGQYDEARVLFRDRLNQPTYYQLGAYQLRIELLRALFPDGEDRPPRLKDEAAQAWTLNALANSYALSGQPRRAAALFERSNVPDEKRGNKQGVAIGLGNLAQEQMAIGALRAAEASLRRSVALCREIGDEFGEAVGHQELGRVLACRGAWDEAEEELAAALALNQKRGNVQAQGLIWAYRALRALLMGRAHPSPPALRSGSLRSPLPSRERGVEALAAARRALELADETARTSFPYERDYVRAHWLLGAALRVDGQPGEAGPHLDEALARCRAINLVEFEAGILIQVARLRAGEGQAGEAGRLADEARALAERCGYVLQQADAHLALARLALDAGDRRAARGHAQAARELATCDGAPDCTYKAAYHEAGEILDIRD